MKYKKEIFISLMIIALAVGAGYIMTSALESGRQILLLGLWELLFVFIVFSFGNHKLVMMGTFAFFWLPLPSILATQALFRRQELFEFVVEMSLGLVLLAGVPGLLAKKINRFPFLPFILYILGALIAYQISYKDVLSFSVVRIVCMFPLFLSLLIYILVNSKENANLLLWILLISSAALAVLILVGPSVFQSVTAYDYAEGTDRLSMQLKIGEIGVLSIDPQAIAEKFAFMLVIAYAFWLTYPTSIGRVVALMLCIIFGLVIIFSQGRGGLIAAIVSIAVESILLFKWDRKNRSGIISAFVLATLVILGSLIYLASQSSNSGYTQRIFGLLSNPLNDPYLLVRLNYWQASPEVILNNIFGVGAFGFPKPGSDTWIVHNLFLYIQLCFGIFGLLGFIMILVRFFRTFWRGAQILSQDGKTFSIIGIGCITCFLVAGITSPMIFQPYTVVMIWGPLATLYAIVDLYSRDPVLENPIC
jgi:hypothetical protein